MIKKPFSYSSSSHFVLLLLFLLLLLHFPLLPLAFASPPPSAARL